QGGQSPQSRGSEDRQGGQSPQSRGSESQRTRSEITSLAGRTLICSPRERIPMAYLHDIVYLLIFLALSPWLLYKALTTGKYRRGLGRKFLGTTFARPDEKPCAWFHGVSVGEVHLLRQVVALFRQRHPDWDCVISTTTDTGFEEARKRFLDLPVFYWPF